MSNENISASTDGFYVGYGGSAKSLAVTTEGNGNEKRQGREIQVTRVEVNYSCLLNAAVCGSMEFPRLIMLYDTQSNGAVPANTEILELQGAAFANESQKFLNYGNKERFVVLYDRYWSLPTYEITAGMHIQRAGPTDENIFTGRIDLDVDFPVVYATGGSVPLSGNIILFCSGSVFLSGSGTSKWFLQYQSRITFLDN